MISSPSEFEYGRPAPQRGGKREATWHIHASCLWRAQGEYNHRESPLESYYRTYTQHITGIYAL